jgi:mRNA interferase MazF
MRRGEVWWANLPEPSGSGPGMRRPVLIIQSNPFNESRIATVVVAIITSNLGLADFPGNVRVGKTESGLSKPSVVNVSQLLTIDRSLIIKKTKMLHTRSLRRVNEGIRLVLAL